ncbi:MAG: ligase-associated DNA damage response endonuclease PdeM [Weeksellaceae bacterium]|nr:ligase-associated DNA damage response endonuclease PdeM [Weeksellaceae bacterium]
MHQSLTIHGVQMDLLPGRAVFLPATQVCIIADLHLGKTEHFRKHGIPIPGEVAKKDLQNLSLLLQKTSAKELIIAGDFFHDSANSELNLFHSFREKHSLPIHLVKGNHDRLSSDLYTNFDLNLVDELQISSHIIVRHEPTETSTAFVICGHIHPGIALRGPSRQGFKLPAFLLNSQELVLPAFSRFTGLDTAYATASHKAFILAENRVVEC